MSQNDGHLRDRSEKLVNGLEGFPTLSGIVVAHRFIGMKEERGS
jgi:hypothetical protein